MKERPILFSGPMVRAILEGTKTQTRRIVQPQPALQLYQIGDSIEFAPKSVRDGDAPDWSRCQTCPYGQPGDRLWVRETVALVPATAYRGSDGVQTTPNPDDPTEVAIYRAGWDRAQPGTRWRPSIHMPRWASRITLEITGVRVERVQDISMHDAMDEGVGMPRYDQFEQGSHLVGAFRDLWDAINGPRGYGWASNPWVWVLAFTRL